MKAAFSVNGHKPGRGWVWTRRLTQGVFFFMLLVSPVLGGWQRLDRTDMALWESDGWNLPSDLRDRLPLAQWPARAYDSMVAIGGGSAAEIASIPAVDPVAGTASLFAGHITWRFLVALLIPMLLAAVLGRVFCGWMCPFGTLSRWLATLRPRRPFRIPRHRPIRWLVLVGVMLASALGAHAVLFFFLPHLLVQQSIYSMWLLGGGGAALGALLGIVVAGLFFGPTMYCATLCPTGAFLGLLGRFKVLRIGLEKPSECGAHCEICDRVCWLGLEPSSGDPGPDCDSCTRCFERCPKVNMRVGVRRKHLPVIMGALLAVALPASASAATEKPELLLNAEVRRGDVSIGVSVVNLEGVKLDPDDVRSQHGVEVSTTFARGPLGEADERGEYPLREMYAGPLAVSLRTAAQDYELTFDAPNHPRSTLRRSIYRSHVDLRMGPGDEVEIAPIEGWLDKPLRVRIPSRGVAPSVSDTLWSALAAFLVFAGLLSIAVTAPSLPGRHSPPR